MARKTCPEQSEGSKLETGNSKLEMQSWTMGPLCHSFLVFSVKQFKSLISVLSVLSLLALLLPAACGAQVVIQGNVTLRGKLTLNGVNISLTPSQSATAYATPVTFTATMPSSMASGSITFYDGATALATVPIFSGTGTAQLTVSSLAVGTHSITAFYPTAGVTSAAVMQTVTNASSSISLGSSANPSAVNQPVTFTGYLTPNLCSGSVTFYDSGVPLGSGTVSTGSATFTTSSLAAGSHSITASYGGDGNCGGSTAPALGDSVSSTLTRSSVTLTANPTTWYSGQQVTFTATVSPAPPNGETVAFYDGNNYLNPATATTNGGVASLATTNLTVVAQHTITAYYPGDNTLTASTSNPLTQNVAPYITLSLPQGPPQMGIVISVNGATGTASLPTLQDANHNVLMIFNLLQWGTSSTVQVPSTASPPLSGSVIVTVNSIASNPVAFSVVNPFGCQ